MPDRIVQGEGETGARQLMLAQRKAAAAAVAKANPWGETRSDVPDSSDKPRAVVDGVGNLLKLNGHFGRVWTRGTSEVGLDVVDLGGSKGPT